MYPLRQLGILLIKEFHFCFKLYPGKVTNKSNDSIYYYFDL